MTPEALRPAALAEIDEAAWDASAESLLRSALWTAQAAHTRMREHGGRIVLLTATAGLVGAAQRAPFACAMEGIRSLAKVAARKWGTTGITLNCIAIAVDPPDGGPLPPALGRSVDVGRDLAAVIELCAGDAGRVLTGVTIPVDGGVVMTP